MGRLQEARLRPVRGWTPSSATDQELTYLFSAHVEPFWHAWLSYSVDTPPNKDPLGALATNRPWAAKEHIPNLTFTRQAYKPYST